MCKHRASFHWNPFRQRESLDWWQVRENNEIILVTLFPRISVPLLSAKLISFSWRWSVFSCLFFAPRIRLARKVGRKHWVCAKVCMERVCWPWWWLPWDWDCITFVYSRDGTCVGKLCLKLAGSKRTGSELMREQVFRNAFGTFWV